MNDLEKRAETAGYEKKVNMHMVKYSAKVFSRYIDREASILELGPAEGSMTDLLAPQFGDYTIVDAVDRFCREITQRHVHVEAVVSMFENYSTERKFDVILMGSILDALQYPDELLQKARHWLNENGLIIASVANSHSVHRQAAVLMGLLENENSFGTANVLMGHNRIYDRGSFEKLFIINQFNIEASGGYWLKPLSNSQIESYWTDEMLEAFMRLGEWYPEIAAELYIVASVKE